MTDDTIALPPLPEPRAYIFVDTVQTPIFEVDQLEAYAREAVRLYADNLSALRRALNEHDINVECACADACWDKTAQAVISAADALFNGDSR